MDFTAATDADIAAFLVAHQHELDVDGISTDELMGKSAAGAIVIERELMGRGVAVVEPEGRPNWCESPGAYLWLLWINPEARGSGVGRRFVRALMKKHANVYLGRVRCHGP